MQYTKQTLAALLTAATSYRSVVVAFTPSSSFHLHTITRRPPSSSSSSSSTFDRININTSTFSKFNDYSYSRKSFVSGRRSFTATSMGSSLTFTPPSTTTTPSVNVNPSEAIIIGRKAHLTSTTITSILSLNDNDNVAAQQSIDAMLTHIKDAGKATTFLSNGIQLTIIILPAPEKISRHNHPFSPHTITDSLSGIASTSKDGCVQIYVVDEDIEEFMCPTAAAIARALPLYNSKSSSSSRTKKDDSDETESESESKTTGVSVSFYNEKGEIVNNNSLISTSTAVAEGVRLSARLGDMPPAELSPDTYAQECRTIATTLQEGGANVTFEEILDQDLKDGGYGGIYGVGMAAQCPPRMIIITYTPPNETTPKEHIALCGKGVVYDTGGLSLKPKTGMAGMKHDMGGSAGVLGGFQAAVQLQLPRKITLVLAIVENSIGPDAVRNDDILTMKSGKTVEINNTDAEGRLILADCVSYASNSIEGGVDVILDMATLTGAQLVCTGKKHAGILAKTAKIEQRILACGMKTGDLAYPMLYAPELLKSEFASKVADMKNSVKDRGNAQASCAGHFIESHIDEAYEGDWVHVDMAGPDCKNERATGYGVALVLGLLEAPGFC